MAAVAALMEFPNPNARGPPGQAEPGKAVPKPASAQEVYNAVQDFGVVVVDIRDAETHRKSHIEGSVHAEELLDYYKSITTRAVFLGEGKSDRERLWEIARTGLNQRQNRSLRQILVFEVGFEAFRAKYSFLCVNLSEDEKATNSDGRSGVDGGKPGGKPRAKSQRKPKLVLYGRKKYPHEILSGFLYLSNQIAASKNYVIANLKIGAIVNATPGFPCKFEDEGVDYLRVALNDAPNQSEEMEKQLPRAIKFIDSARANGKRVLVHCQAGISRSSTIIIAYLMSREGMSYEVARSHVATCRPMIRPNWGFAKLLMRLETQHNTTGDELSTESKSNNSI